jgi:hypothetical protein
MLINKYAQVVDLNRQLIWERLKKELIAFKAAKVLAR